jgi:hypothetical protein
MFPKADVYQFLVWARIALDVADQGRVYDSFIAARIATTAF